MAGLNVRLENFGVSNGSEWLLLSALVLAKYIITNNDPLDFVKK